jgi:hypothetical protein
MKILYDNEQDRSDAANGREITTAQELAAVLDERRIHAPFMARLTGDNGYELVIGMGGGVACAQYSLSSGDPPYFLAVAPQRHVTGKYVGFLTANSPTEVPSRYILNFNELKQIALHFLETGERSEAFLWEKL